MERFIEVVLFLIGLFVVVAPAVEFVQTQKIKHCRVYGSTVSRDLSVYAFTRLDSAVTLQQCWAR